MATLCGNGRLGRQRRRLSLYINMAPLCGNGRLGRQRFHPDLSSAMYFFIVFWPPYVEMAAG